MMREHGMCQTAELYYFACLEKDCGDIPDEVLQHLNTCEHCHRQMTMLCAQIKQGQQEKPSRPLLTQHYHLLDQWVTCEQVRPFLSLLSMSGQDVSVVTPVTAHIDRCPDCAKDFQTLLRLGLSNTQLQEATCFLSDQAVDSLDDNPELKSILEQIISRPASSVATRTIIDSSQEMGVDDEIPLEIEQAERIEPKTASDVTPAEPRTRRYPVARIVSMAAVLALAAYLLIQPASVKGVGMRDVYAALGQVANVCIKTVVPEKVEPIQTLWVSSSQQAILRQSQGQTVLWSFDHQTQHINGELQQDWQQTNIAPDMMQLPWGLLPFRHLSELPEDHEWTPVDHIHELNGQPVLVYDYAWQDGGPDMIIQRKWRGYLDPQTKLPRKIEWWSKLPGQTFRVVTTQVVEYPTDLQVETAIRQTELTPTP